ncbi:potassium transporter [Candidatus Endobugula sertula]|uniref:Potassium transporter n=1 Tax=Candidatus Endobugula sertula TaxID=62101 RepID=A0A1D2QN38_9GAMM|nr:potassium transporter [Candidatus Endobugula sertula]
MVKRVLVIGSYGNFGSFIVKELVKDKDIQVIIAGRSLEKANQLIDSIVKGGRGADHQPDAAQVDIHKHFPEALQQLKPDIVIHTSGPFQAQSYDVANACVDCGADYIDLADGREFVAGITELHEKAKQAGVTVISGASSVPCLTSAIVDYYIDEFTTLESLDYGITTAQKTTRGLATTAAILGYTGKAFNTLVNGKLTNIYGWQGLKARNFHPLGLRLLGYCDIPDLALFPERYPSVKTLRFYAGLEIKFIHLILWSLSWLVRMGLINNLRRSAPLLLKLSFLFDWLGSASSGFYMELSGKDNNGSEKSILFELVAHSGDGPYIPCMPAILLTKKLANGQIAEKGAYPCVDFISYDEYLSALGELDITWRVNG